MTELPSEAKSSANRLEVPMRLRWCRSRFRRITLTKLTLLVFVVGIVYFCSLQLYHVPVTSASNFEKKQVIPVSVVSEKPVTEEVLVGAKRTEAPKKEVVEPSRVVGNGRSPKQVDEDNQSDTNKPQNLNQTRKSAVNPAFIPPLPSLPGPSSLELLQNILFRVNKEQAVYNAAKFPPLGPDGLVLIVQVHKREGYLKQLFESLKATRGIEKVLLVISHDYYYDDMNELIRSIDFCRVS